MDSTRFLGALAAHGLDLFPVSVDTLQLNVTRLCNQACAHCHVEASPARGEMMSDTVLDRCVEIVAKHPGIRTVDITGGAPELHPGFERLLGMLEGLGRRVIIRHNLTVTIDPHPLTGASMRHLPELFARHGVEVAASLPCYTASNVDRQRGAGAFSKSIESLRLLNAAGYGVQGRSLVLDLVSNPGAAVLPGDQSALEADYRCRLGADHGIVFDRLFALANLPVGRFASQFATPAATDAYLDSLAEACNPSAALGVMCRSMVSVAPDGTLHDCDFNQMLGLAIGARRPRTIFDFDERALMSRTIRFADHCLACTAGAGSSCGGATAA
jgi:radical SAM/Cys-rich protein